MCIRNNVNQSIDQMIIIIANNSFRLNIKLTHQTLFCCVVIVGCKIHLNITNI